MKKNELHNLIRQHIPQIAYLETESPEAAEGECTLWDSDDSTVMLDFADNKSDCHTVVLALQNVAEKLNFINENKDLILEKLLPEHADLPDENVRVAYAAFLIENATDVFCDFVLTAENWHECVAAFSLEDDNELIFNGLETA